MNFHAVISGRVDFCLIPTGSGMTWAFAVGRPGLVMLAILIEGEASSRSHDDSAPTYFLPLKSHEEVHSAGRAHRGQPVSY